MKVKNDNYRNKQKIRRRKKEIMKRLYISALVVFILMCGFYVLWYFEFMRLVHQALTS
jgi:hypothetical protein